MSTPAEYDELRTWKRHTFRLGAGIAGSILTISLLSVKIHNINKEYAQQVNQNNVLSDKITDLTNNDTILRARIGNLEDIIFTGDYYPAVKELQNKAKKDPKIREFVDYLGFLESEAREKSATVEEYNKNLKNILFEKSKTNTYFKENLQYFPQYLLKYFPMNK